MSLVPSASLAKACQDDFQGVDLVAGVAIAWALDRLFVAADCSCAESEARVDFEATYEVDRPVVAAAADAVRLVAAVVVVGEAEVARGPIAMAYAADKDCVGKERVLGSAMEVDPLDWAPAVEA